MPDPFLLPCGDYFGALLDVREVAPSRTRAERAVGNRWEWHFGVRTLVLRTSLAEEDWALRRLKATYAAFGDSPETCTDELIGRRVRLQVDQINDDNMATVDRIVRGNASALSPREPFRNQGGRGHVLLGLSSVSRLTACLPLNRERQRRAPGPGRPEAE